MTLYLGKTVQVTETVLNLAGVTVVNGVAPTNPGDMVTKGYADTLVLEQKTRIDALLDGSSLNLDSLQEIVSYVDTLSGTEAGNLITTVNTLNTSINTEQSRAIAAETVLSQLISTESSRALLAETGLSTSIAAVAYDALTNNNLEAQRAQNAENTLQINITTESGRALAAETLLQSNIDAEASRAQAAETLLQSNIDAEASRALAAESILQSNIDVEASRALAAETLLQSNLDAEASRALAAETLLQSNLNAEASRALAAEILLQSNLDGSIEGELSRAQAAESDLQSNIDAESSRALAAETLLQSNIDAEASRALAAESQLESNMMASETILIESIQTEVSRAQAAETLLQSNLDAEASRALAAETLLQSNLDAEASRALAAESTLNNLILDEGQRASEAEQLLQTNLDTEISRAEEVEGVLREDLDSEVGRAEASEEALGLSIDSNKQNTLLFWNPNPYVVSATEPGVSSNNKPRKPESKVAGWNFTSVGATNTVTLRVLQDSSVFNESIVPHAIINTLGETVNKDYISTLDPSTGKYTYMLQSNWTIVILSGGSITVSCPVQLISGIAHMSNVETAIAIGTNIISGSPLVVSADIVANQLLWTLVPKLRATTAEYRAISMRLKVNLPGEYPTIKVNFGSGNIITYTFGGDIMSTYMAENIQLKSDGNTYVDEQDNDYNIYLVMNNSNFIGNGSRIQNIQVTTSGNTLASFDISEIGILSTLGTERMVLDSSQFAIDEGNVFSSVSRTRLDSLYEYFFHTDSSVNPNV